MRARAAGSASPFRDVRVAARSAIQAEAILRRQGLEVEPAASRIVPDAADSERAIMAAAPGPLLCTRCGYDLDGLAVGGAIIDCPECGFPQVVLAYVADPGGVTAGEQARGVRARTPTGGNFAAGCLAGMVLMGLTIAFLLSASAW